MPTTVQYSYFTSDINAQSILGKTIQTPVPGDHGIFASAGSLFRFDFTDVLLKNTAQTLADGIKLSFNPNATNAGVNIGGHTAAPSAPVDGDIYLNTTTNQLFARINAAWVDLGAGAGGGINNVVEDVTPQLGGMLDVNTFALGDGTLELLKFVETASAVNELTITNAATAGSPALTASGDDANIDLTLDGKGTGTVKTLSSNLNIAGDIIVSGTVDGIDISTDVAANTAKVTNATHTGDVTGSGALTIGAKKVTIAMLADGTDGELITWGTTGVAETVAVGTSGQVLTSNGVGAAPTFQAAAGGLPVVDTTSIAKGSADATKLVKFEVDGNTTGIVGTIATAFTTAKTVTLPDATDTLVGRATTDTLTNKSIDSDNNTITNLANADIKVAAAIELRKLATMPGGQIIVGDATSVPTSRAVSGDATLSDTGVLTVGFNKIGNDKLTDVATNTIKGRVTAGTNDPEDLTGTQATTILDVFTSALKGLAPASGGGTTNFLRADGTWIAPSGSGDMVLAGVQTVTGAKTFNDTKLLLRNVANTFNGSFVNTNTADRVYTLPDATDTLVGRATTDTFTNKTFDANAAGNSLSNIDIADHSATGTPDATTFYRGDNTWATPAGSGDMVLASVQTVTGAKTFADDAFLIQNPATTFEYLFQAGAIAADRTITLPVLTGNDTLVFEAHTQALTNKTINTASNTITVVEADISDLQSYLLNISGLAPDTATTAAAQPNITSLGTLTALQVDNININGNTISSTAGTDLLITPLAGQQLVLDGTIILDAGVITGATSITSTSFVGALTGNADTVTTNANLTGDVTSVGNATTIAVDAVDIAMLSATGTPDATTFLRGDNTWAVPGGSGDMVLASVQTVTGAKTFGTIGGAVGKFILAGSTSGSTIVNAAAVAGSTTITFPGTTGTVALLGDKLSAFAATTKAELETVISDVANFAEADGDTYSGAHLFNAATMRIPLSATPTMAVDGDFAIDTTVTDMSHGVLKYYDGEELAVIAVPIAQLNTPTDGHVVAYNATNNEFELVPGGGGGGATDTEFAIPLLQGVPEGTPGHPDVHALVTGSANVTGSVLPDGASASEINFKTAHPVPDSLAGTPAARIEFVIMTKGAVAGPKDVRLTVSSLAVADTENMDAAFTGETETTVTMPTATETIDVYSQDMTNDPVAGDTVLVKLKRDPTDVADDFTADIQIISATLFIKRST